MTNSHHKFISVNSMAIASLWDIFKYSFPNEINLTEYFSFKACQKNIYNSKLFASIGPSKESFYPNQQNDNKMRSTLLLFLQQVLANHTLKNLTELETQKLLTKIHQLIDKHLNDKLTTSDPIGLSSDAELYLLPITQTLLATTSSLEFPSTEKIADALKSQLRNTLKFHPTEDSTPRIGISAYLTLDLIDALQCTEKEHWPTSDKTKFLAEELDKKLFPIINKCEEQVQKLLYKKQIYTKQENVHFAPYRLMKFGLDISITPPFDFSEKISQITDDPFTPPTTPIDPMDIEDSQTTDQGHTDVECSQQSQDI